MQLFGGYDSPGPPRSDERSLSSEEEEEEEEEEEGGSLTPAPARRPETPPPPTHTHRAQDESHEPGENHRAGNETPAAQQCDPVLVSLGV
ncbi:UNVERIFIED_CONTAM: hypothetical protein FKN15_008065 [Acipenser sinensis]